MKKEESNLTEKLSYFLIGGGIGAILALLFAPKAGEELRSDIADATRTGLAKTENLASQINETAQDVYADTKTKAAELYDTTKQRFESAATAITETPANMQTAVHETVEQIARTIEAGKKQFDREIAVAAEKAKAKAI